MQEKKINFVTSSYLFLNW